MRKPISPDNLNVGTYDRQKPGKPPPIRCWGMDPCHRDIVTEIGLCERCYERLILPLKEGR